MIADLLRRAAEATYPGATGPVPGGSRWRDAAIQHAVESAWRDGNAEAVRQFADNYGSLLMLEPRFGDDVRLASIGPAQRRVRGAFATPPALAAEVARRALPEAAARAQPAVVDPACGSGALLRAALLRLLRCGVPAREAALCLHGVDVDPVAVAVCRTVLAVELTAAGWPCAPDDLADRIRAGDALVDFDWAAAFPAVLDGPRVGEPAPDPVTGWRGGFTAVLANPPWERLKVIGREWDGAPPPGLRDDRADAARAVRQGGRHPLTGRGELNAYLPFIETCWRLLAPDGRAALIVPAGVAADRAAAGLIEALVSADCLDRLQLLDPPGPIFPGVSAGQAVALLDLRGGPTRSPPTGSALGAEIAVGVVDPAEHPLPQAWRVDAAMLRAVNPNTGTLPLCQGPRDARLLLAAHRRWPVLRSRRPEASHLPESEPDGWRLRLVTPLHMTRDARWFAAEPGPGLLPLWEAKHAGLLDHRGGGRPVPRYWVPRGAVLEQYGELCDRGWLAGYRNVTTSRSARTLLPCALPVVGVGNSLPLIDAPRLPLLLAALASLPVDYLVRQKHAGANLNFFKLEQAAVPAPAMYDVPAPWQPERTIADWVLARFAAAVAWESALGDELVGLRAELTTLGVPVPVHPPDAAGAGHPPDAAAAGHPPDAAAAGHPPDAVAAGAGERRARALAELDAAHAYLLGWTDADFAHVLGTFTELRRRELRQLGEYRTERLGRQALRSLMAALH